MRKVFVAFLVSIFVTASAWAKETAPKPANPESETTVETVKDAVSEGVKSIGHTTRDVTRAIGHATRDTVKAIGHGTRDAVHGTGQAVEDAWKDLTKDKD